MSGKRIDRSVWSNGFTRRSPRISALDQKQDKTDTICKVTPLHKKGQKRYEQSSGIKRKQQEQDIESENSKQLLSTNDQEKKMLDKDGELLPEKHLLEFVLDVLQRSDMYEIFAEPVDPQKVEDYYEIIKEPMDIGTMRAKLHEGMYNTLEEFEHDAFLIPKNALLFNASNSVYFKQARAIDDLAKKVFHVLKTNPKKLKSEFPETRRRTSRRVQEGKGLKIYPRSRLATNDSPGGTDDVFPQSGAQYSDNDPSDLSKPMKGAKDGKEFNVNEVDRRSTYKPPLPFDWGNGTMVSMTPGGPKVLTHVNQESISYSESLMKFAKGLGPVAQMVAKRKLRQGCTNLQQYPGTLQAPIDLNDIDDETNSCTAYENDTRYSNSKISGGYEVFNGHVSKPRGDLYCPTNCVDNSNLLDIRLDEKVENPMLGIGFRNGFKRGFSNLRPSDESASPFAFNLSFLKSKLNQMEHHSGTQLAESGSH